LLNFDDEESQLFYIFEKNFAKVINYTFTLLHTLERTSIEIATQNNPTINNTIKALLNNRGPEKSLINLPITPLQPPL